MSQQPPNLCDFDVTVFLHGDGLLGHTLEYGPYFEMHATFGQYKVKDRVDMALVGSQPRPLLHPVLEKATGDDYRYDNVAHTYRSTAAKNFRLQHDGLRTRVDEAVNIELWCHTRVSGIK